MEKELITPPLFTEHKGIALFKKAQAKKKFVSEHLAKGGTVQELEEMGFKFGTLDIRNLTTKSS